MLVNVWGWIGDARELWTAGVKPEYLQLFGFVLFVISVVTVVARQQQHLEERLAGIEAQKAAIPVNISEKLDPPQPKAAKQAPVTEESADASEVKERDSRRQYVPEQFVSAFEEFFAKDHTELQVQAFLQPHAGQWIRVCGSLFVLVTAGEDIIVMFETVSPAKKGRFRVRFGPKWTSQLARLSPGDNVLVEACITGLPSVELAQGELL